MSQIRHRNIVKLHRFCLHHRCKFLVYEYMERGSLFSALNMDDDEAKELRALVSLQELYIEFNQINGSIRSEFQNLINLCILHLSHNMISVHEFDLVPSLNIPLEIKILDSLCDVNLSNNKLEGLIPSPMLNCISFGEVNLSNNLLSRNIPSKISYVKKLDMSHNLLSGSVLFFFIKDGPYIPGRQFFLSSSDLSYNNLTGNLPI
ncbi:hypothetical protein Ahy_A06g029534 [Arachis hypogaea]|uniref:Serine-threonine/tyrosine-protein kinase catalytic domain-containing protein n=1 Tax=Arachis hypogaea TaxID=3818 RepID=A0A445CTN3_ARAHY|nr:hypothetical protein Ahy_A06g029534 [Arachis hypogaea]